MTDRELMQQALDYIIETNRISSFQLVPASRSNQVITALRDRLAQPEQEPVAWGVPNTRPTERQPFMMLLHSTDGCQYPEMLVPLYTAPRQWQGLTDEEIGLLTTNDKWSHIETPVLALFARAIEAKLKEKNARPIKPLTDEEIDTYFQEYINTGSLLSFADGVRFAEAAHSGAIEAKLREKNT